MVEGRGLCTYIVGVQEETGDRRCHREGVSGLASVPP